MEAFVADLKCIQCDQTRQISDLTLCSACGHNEIQRQYFCDSHCRETSCGHKQHCDIDTHLTCWDGHLSGFSARLQKGHQKRNALYDACIQVIMPPQVDEATQRRLHEADREAEWFRVTMASLTAQGSQPLLQISDRFRKTCDPGRGNYWRLKQYPSFVSFIGDTGVGKSTLVRAMITVGAIEQMEKAGQGIDFEQVFRCQSYGPVTRTTSSPPTLPTSVGVHLYRDQTLVRVPHDTAGRTEDVPILYADCEGFAAGSMITDAERSAAVEGGFSTTRQRSGSNASNSSQQSLPSASSRPSRHFGAAPQSSPSGMEPQYVDKEMTIKAPEFKDKGKQSADLFYARFLYAFSDVIVFVIKEDVRMKREMQRLLEWAVSAVKKSIRGNSSKTLVVVRNGPPSHDDKFYDPADLNNELFSHFGEIWDDSRILTNYKLAHDDQCTRWQDRIHDNEGYFSLFFRNVTICYIPSRDKSPSSEIYQQYRRLRKLIVEGTSRGQRERSNSYTRYDVPSITHLLNRAFEHFANSNEPFDFHAAARRDNPTPVSVPGHIANLLRHMGSLREQLEKFEIFVAVCLVTYIYRSFDFAREPEESFEELLKEKCLRGIQIYQQEFQRCALPMGDGTRCVNYQYNHGSHHCSASEKKLIWKGAFDFSAFAKDTLDVINGIRRAFIGIYQEVYSGSGRTQERNKPSLDTLCDYRRRFLSRERAVPSPTSTPRINRRATLKAEDFVEPNQVWRSLKSNMSCFACLQYPPDHVLPCGHGFCEECVKDFGQVSSTQRYHYTLKECVLCDATASQWLEQLNRPIPAAQAEIDESKRLALFEQLPPQTVRLNPRCAGVRVLTLDGGGVRGMVELAILEKIEQRVNLKIPIRDLFDLVIGTSTGGIISLALALDPESMSNQEMRQQFSQLAQKTFEYDRFGHLWNFDLLNILNRAEIVNIMMVFRVVRSRYQSRKLRRSLLQIFPEMQPIFGDSTVTGKQRRIRVAVTATHDGEPCIFSNYSRASYERDEGTDRDHDHLVENKGFERQDQPNKEARVWEAAMATSAAPGFFHEWGIDDPEKRRQDKVPFVDGALHSNLPVECALEEKERIWPEHQRYSKPIDILLSVGTGRQPGKFKTPKWFKLAPASAVEAAKTYMKKVFNTDLVWQAFQQSQRYDSSRHHRLTIDLESEVRLDDWEKMNQLYDEVHSAYKASRSSGSLWYEIDQVSYRLTAALLFFEPERVDIISSARKQELIKGHIWCRLDALHPAMRLLIHRIEGFYHQEAGRQPTPLLRLNTQRRQNLLQGNAFSVPCNIGSTDDHTTVQLLCVNLLPPAESGDPTLWPISGFPITFDQLKAGLKQRGQK